MGIQDRDYYREGPSFLDRVSQQGATVWLIAITCGIFFGQALSVEPPRRGVPDAGPMWRSTLTALGAFNSRLILEGEVWRLVTPMFLHGDIFHIFFNMLVLYFIGQRLEAEYGSREFVLMYLCGGAFASVFRLGLQATGLAGPATSIGASGAVMAVLIVYAFHWPHQRVLLFFVIPMPMWLLAILYIGIDSLGAFQAELGRANRSAIDHLAHLGGAFFGLLYYQSGVRLGAVFDRRRSSPRVRPKLRVVPPPEGEPEPVGAPVATPPRAADEQLEAKLDAVLEKVSKHGPDSLTPEEREILVQASELYKKRRK